MEDNRERYKQKQSSQSEGILNSIRAKVIFGFFLFIGAMTISWLVVQFTIDEMIVTVDRFSEPNHKLTLAEDLFKHIVQIEQDQKAKAIENPNLPLDQLLAGSEGLRLKLDTLYLLLYYNDAQTQRIDSMQKLLQKRDEWLIDYLELRAEMGDNKPLRKRIDEMSELLMKMRTPDSSVVSTEKRITTTTFFPESAKEEEKEPSFFDRLFNKDKKEQAPGVSQPVRIVKREEDIKIDTVVSLGKDSILTQAVDMMGELQQDQHIRNLRFKRQEYELLNSSGQLIRDLMKLSYDIQKEEMRQEKITTKDKTAILQKGIQKYSFLISVFFLGSGLIVFLIFFDISKSSHFRKKLEEAKEEAERLNQVKQRFLTNMSHEIRTPLQSIIGFAEQMVDHRHEMGEHEMGEKAANAIYHSSHHLLQVVNEVLDYNKLESNKFTLENQPFNIALVLQEVVDVFKQQCMKKGIKFNYLIDFEALEDSFYLGDAFRLKQILYNLLGNAVKFTDEGSITLEVKSNYLDVDTEFTFVISDSGSGIPREDQDRIFMQFEQVSQDGAPRDGIGLGLSIVQALVTAKGGKLELQSEAGTGSTFLVTLCYEQVAKPHEISKVNGSPLISQGNPDMAIMVDDDHFILELCEVILTRHKVPFRQHLSAEDLLSTNWEQAKPGTLFLIDMVLPGVSGLELSNVLKERLGNTVRVVALTAQVVGKDISDFLEMGFDDVLMKPFKEDELMAVIRKSGDHKNNNMQPMETRRPDQPDITDLLQMSGNDMDQMREFLENFVLQSAKDLETINMALDQEDFPIVTELIHRLAGRCGQMGVYELARDLRKLEKTLREGLDDAKDHKAHIADVLRRVDRLIANFQNDLSEKVL